MTTFAPRSAAEVTDVVRWAVTSGEALEVVAGGTRRSLGRPVEAPHVLDVSALRGVVSYEPEELVLTASPGTPLEEIEALLASRGQCLAFEPPSGMVGMPPGSRGTPTLGGAVATAMSGPRRLKAGAVRDHVLGVAAVSGRGESFVGGGKVVKNVTGYDMPKLLTGSYGTLAVLTEITVKVLPASEDTRTLIVTGASASRAVALMTGILQSAADVSGACHLPAGLQGAVIRRREAVTALRLEGVVPSVEFRLARLRDMLSKEGDLQVLDRDESVAFWRAVRDVTLFASEVDRPLWRVSVPPASGAVVLANIDATVPGAQGFIDWGGGLLWVQLPTPANETEQVEQATRVRAALGEGGGHATLMRAPGPMRAKVDVFQPQAPAVASLSMRLKKQFDPKQILNPGRMVAGL